MFKDLRKYLYMIRLGYRYIKLYKKTYFHPFLSPKESHRQLSKKRQEYSNAVLKYLNISVELHGTIPKHDRVLYAINHRSLLDIIVMENIFSRYKKNGVWIAKQELFDAFYGDFFKYSGCISVDVENKKGLMKFFKEIKYKLAKVNDLNIYIFPEGERHKSKGIKKFQTGATNIAKTNNLETRPVFIDDTLESVFKEAPFEQTKIVRVYVGEPIEPSRLEEEYRIFIENIKGKTDA